MKRFLQFFLVFALASVSLAQEPSSKKDSPEFSQPPEKIYKLNFLIYELEDGKKINERTYMVPVVTVAGKGRNSTIRVGDRVPIVTAASLSSAQPEKQIQYVDIGLSIECSVTEQADKFIVGTELSISSVVPPEQTSEWRGAGGGNPVVRQIRQQFTTVVPPGKSTLVTSIDDINSKKRLQVEVTATRIE